MRAIYIDAIMLTNTDEVKRFIKDREPVYSYLYVCSPEFYTDKGVRYYKVKVSIYQRVDDGRNLKAG